MTTKLYLLLLTLVIVLSCSTGNKKVKIVDTNFGEEIPIKTVLNFSFDEELVPDSIVGNWSDDEYITFDPEIEGKFMWVNKKELSFTPKGAFKPATSYTCKLKSDILKYSDIKTFMGEKQYSFHTPWLDLDSGRAFWESPENNTGEPYIKIELQFNYDIVPAEVTNLLEVKIDNENQRYSLVSDEIDDKVFLKVTGLKREDKDYPVDITIKKGLVPHLGTEKSQKDFTRNFNILSPFKLNISDVQAHHDGSEGILTVYITQEVESGNIKNYISISPNVKYTVEIQPGCLLIKSENFNFETQYEVTIRKGLLGKIGGELKYDYVQPVSFGQVEPTIRFVDQKGLYVSGKGGRNIQVTILNVPKVTVKITKLYENNILGYLNSQGYSNYYYEEYYDEDYYYNYHDPGNLGDIIYKKEIQTRDLPLKGSNRVLSMDFEDKLAGNKGIYVLEVKSDEDYWLRASKLVAISDIGLIVKSGKNNVTVFANSIKTAEPLADVEIRFIGNNNQITNVAKTNKEGVVVFEYSELKATGFKTTLVSAQLNDDYNAIALNNTMVNTSRFDVGGLYENPSGFAAFIYGDRDLYRPGETVNLSGIIRNYEWQKPGNIPLIVRFITPNGKTYKTIKKVLNEQGSFETQIDLLPTATTGSYTANIYTTNNVLIGSQIIRVEEFMPDRIKVNLNLDKEEYKPGDNINVGIEAFNLFGTPAANRNYEVELSTKRLAFYPKTNSGYNYFIKGAENTFDDQIRNSETDQDGKALETFEIPSAYNNMGVLKSDIFLTVFDETGRPVSRLKSINIFTQKVFYGIRNESYYQTTGQPARFDLIAVDKNGKELSGVTAEVKLIKHDYKTVLSQSNNGYFRYRSEKVEKIVEKKTITLNATSAFYSFIPETSGQYELRLAAPGSSTYIEQYIYAYGWGSTSYSSFNVNNEGQIDIQLDKEKYNIGEKARVLLKAPFSGKILVTVESNKVLNYFYLNTDKRAASFDLDLKEAYVPNVYISATLFRPFEQSDIPLTVAYGYAPVKVENSDYKMPLTIIAPEKSRSNTKQNIKIKANPNSALTIAVVDEGILQFAGYSTPDPYGFYYQKRALEVKSSNVYPYLFPEIGAIRSQTGGDESELAKRLNPLKNGRVKLLSFWSGIITTNNQGEADYEVNIPQFSGDLRIMAIGYNDRVFGSAESHIKVADPIVISVALPRFLSPGDQVDVPVMVTNTTDKQVKCNTTISTEGPLQVNGSKSGSVTIDKNTEKEVLFHIDAKQEIGQASVEVIVSAMGEKFTDKTEITVRPASTLQKRCGAGTINAGKTQKVNMDINGFIPSSIDCKLVVSKNPLIQFTNSLDYLVHYPYGCIEQTVSSAFPQIYFSDLIGTVYKQKRASIDATQNVQTALNNIKLMQLYSGGLTYWPGVGEESWWGSIYAAHFAIEAKKAGFEIDESFLNSLIKYIKDRLQSKKTIVYYFNFDKKREIAPKEVPYSLYVLALANECPTSMLNYYRTHLDQLSLDGKYLLAGAYALTGDKNKFKEILPVAFEGEKAKSVFGGSFYSYIRDEAIALNVLLEVESDNPQIAVLAKHVSEQLLKSRYLNTQERTFGFLAMGKIARLAAESNIKGTIKEGGKTLGTVDNKTVTLNTDQIKNNNIEISTEGEGRLYYYWESEGISTDGSYLKEDNYLKVRRQFYNRNGNMITTNNFKQNDLVLVEISVMGLTNDYIENVAVADLLPACFEIENPRLKTLPPGLDWLHIKSIPVYIDIRDDRINMFVNATQYTCYYYYLVRVVSPGTYKMGPVSADAMYNSEYHSYNGDGTIVVTRE